MRGNPGCPHDRDEQTVRRHRRMTRLWWLCARCGDEFDSDDGEWINPDEWLCDDCLQSAAGSIP